MSVFTELKSSLIGAISAHPGLGGCFVTEEYPPSRRDFPLGKPVIAVGLDAVELTDSLGGFAAGGAAGVISLRFDIFTPPLGKDTSPHAVMEELWGALLSPGLGYSFTELRCEPISYDKAVEANRLTVRAKLHAMLEPSVDEALISDVRITMGGDRRA
jgi:hypothetical protein